MKAGMSALTATLHFPPRNRGPQDVPPSGGSTISLDKLQEIHRVISRLLQVRVTIFPIPKKRTPVGGREGRGEGGAV